MNSYKNNNDFKFYAQDDLVPITYGEFIRKDKMRKNDSENMSVLKNDIRRTSRYANVLMYSGGRSFMIRVYARINLILEKIPRISAPRRVDRF